MPPSGDAAGADRRFIVTRSVSVIGRATAGAERAVAPNRAASIKDLVIMGKLVSVAITRKKIAAPSSAPVVNNATTLSTN